MSAKRRRLASLALGTAGVALIVACSHSAGTSVTPTGPVQSSGHVVDTFAFNIAADSTWTIAVGDIATYLFGSEGAIQERGELGLEGVPGPVKARLLEDTITINDTLSGPPAGTTLLSARYLAFDSSGNLWMTVAGRHDTGYVIEYTRAQTSQSGSLMPMVTLTGASAPVGLAFDPQGHLWVVDSSANALLEYGGTTLLTGGAPTDTVPLTGITTAGATWAPLAVAIDHQGNVWVSAQPRSVPMGAGSVPSFIVTEFPATAVVAGGTPSPVLTIVGPGSGYGPGMTFDSAGNLWTTNPDVGTATKFAAASLTAGANPTPTVTVSNAVLAGASDIAIDPAGILYVGGSAYSAAGAGIYAFKASAIASSGSPNPALAFTPSTGVSHFTIR